MAAKKKRKEYKQKLSRSLSGRLKTFVWIYAIGISAVHLYMNSFGLIGVVQKNLIHLSLLMSLGFLLTPATKRSPLDRPSIIDWTLFLATLGCGVYFYFGYLRLTQAMLVPIRSDFIYGIVFSLLLIEASRRLVGLPLTILATLFVVYIYVGPYMPGQLAHRGFNLQRILVRMTMTSEGVLGVALMVSASYIFMFILFASFLKATQASKFFNDFAQALTGKARGGPAKVAIFASALTGTINGSSQANVATTGSFTIPLMKETGYTPHFAGAVEAIASTGGVLMPPIMGAAAFIMSSLIGIPYSTIIAAALTPSILYYFTLYNMVDLRAAKMGIVGLDRDKLPDLKEVILGRGYLILPLILIIAALVIGFSPVMAGFIGIISTIVAGAIRKETRLSFMDILNAMAEGAQNAISIAVICGLVGFIIGSVGMTGIGQTIGNNIVSLAGGQLFLTAFLCMIVAIILGMGLPGPACYIVTSTIAAPALMVLGIPVLAAHFFAFYFGIMSAVIPPVALTSFTAGAIAEADTNLVAKYGFLLGAAGMLLPYMFIYNPVILMIDFSWVNYVYSSFSLFVGLYLAAAVIIGMLKIPLSLFERLLFGIASLLLIIPNPTIRLSGLALAVVFYIRHRGLASKSDWVADPELAEDLA
ncbi:TRAP transporter permease [Halanaerobiaceae bacterium Z-7014]|uniref:TRAP transporter permease n=1 Tax=Halonatronomonas betaini TaxID=2778430 RepID=A0A931AVH4_9FIRM|nr:TRAP transporter permease [Halonatronomonas betaini]MBF8435548.1 TRAP transporter permease [Halonatronomonas betaini]